MNFKLTETFRYLQKRKIIIIFFIFIFWCVSYLFLPLNITEENASFEISEGRKL